MTNPERRDRELAYVGDSKVFAEMGECKKKLKIAGRSRREQCGDRRRERCHKGYPRYGRRRGEPLPRPPRRYGG